MKMMIGMRAVIVGGNLPINSLKKKHYILFKNTPLTWFKHVLLSLAFKQVNQTYFLCTLIINVMG